nr:retron system putative HNH endonuclease [Archangium primigenium]
MPDWEAFSKRFPTIKSALKAALVQEQFGVCCYCERDLTGGAHIEHLMPKSLASALTYDYANLLASCEGEKGKGRAPETCGHLKGTRALPIHPLMPDCSAYFVFSSSGTVGPSPEAARHAPALGSISILGRDSARIVALRRVAIADIEAQLPPPGATPEAKALLLAEVQRLLVAYSAPDANGRLAPFATAVVQHLERYLTP